MNKKLLLIIAVVVVIVFVRFLLSPSPREDVWVDNKVSASYPNGVIKESVNRPIRQLFYIDVTGSMTPYYVKDKRMGVVDAMSAVLTLIHRDSTRVRFLGDSEVYLGYANDILQKAYDVKELKHGILRRNLLHVTNFDKMFSLAVDSVEKSPGTIVYLLTDGIQSLNKKDYTMASYLKELRGSIQSSLSDADDLACCIYRYMGEFNGDYVNCREEKVSDQHMARPFYIIAFGNKSNIRWLAEQNDNQLGSPQGKLFIGMHDFEGHKGAVLSKPNLTRIEHPGDKVTLILNLPSCMKKDVVPDLCRIEGVSNPTVVGKKITTEGLEIILPPECGMYTDVDGFVNISVSMPNEVAGNWLSTWSNDDDTLGPDSMTTFGLSSLIRGIVDGLQPDPLYFGVKFKYIP